MVLFPFETAVSSLFRKLPMFSVPDPFDTLLSSVISSWLMYPLPSGLSLFPEPDEPPAFPEVPPFPEPDELPFLPEPPPFPEPPADPSFFAVFDELFEALPVIIPLPAS